VVQKPCLFTQFAAVATRTVAHINFVARYSDTDCNLVMLTR